MRFLLFFLSICLWASETLAICDDVPRKNKNAVLTLIESHHAVVNCLGDEHLNAYPHPVEIPVNGCVMKFRSQNSQEMDTYNLYDSGDLCKLKVGATVKVKLQSVETFCCGLVEWNRMTEQVRCDSKSKSKFLKEPDSDLIMCRSKNVKWKILEATPLK